MGIYERDWMKEHAREQARRESSRQKPINFELDKKPPKRTLTYAIFWVATIAIGTLAAEALKGN